MDEKLALEIERLTKQRKVISQLRSHGASPDVPAELAPLYALLTVPGYPQRAAQVDRDQAVLLSHFSGESAKAYLSGLSEYLKHHPDLVAASVDFTRRFDALGETSSDEQITELVGEFATPLAEVVSSLLPEGQVIELGRAADLLDEYGAVAYSEAQRKTLALLARRFSDPGQRQS
ncbi:hypothetical protein FEF26_15315 [Nesterenkonia salmonea]|uniref:Uncharacterized protein n=1 Tax=Nesterenkonia salmonea TaxID=1804987 RepID=A0A5R9B502_9MICC|nr:hypothetical protein [Nesterenkonia salmonea]TLP90511.1 hypothetical protein FEF26_15315 [Nesterenkonia salmonea]